MARRCLRSLLGLVFFTVAVASPAHESPTLETISIASQQYVINPANIVLAGTSVSVGGPAVTIAGAVVSEDKDEDVFVDGIEVLTGLTNTTEETLSSLLQSTSQSKSCYMICGL